MGVKHAIDVSPSPTARPSLRLSRHAGFWAVAFAFLTVSAFSTVPSSLYGLYERQDHLSPLTITIVYAVYAVGIVVSLLFVGHVSDWYGRRTVLLAALAVATAAAVVFLADRSLPTLLVARVLTGLAVGGAVATATAFITDLVGGTGGLATRRAGIVSTAANVGGLACGPLIAGLLARYTSAGLTLPFIVFLALLIAAAMLVIVTPEGHPAVHPRPRYHPQRLAAPPNARGPFAAAVTGAFMSFAIGGLVAGLTGTLLAGPLHQPSPALTGLAIFLTSVWTSPPSLALFLTAVIVAGAGQGAILRGSLTVAISITGPDDRAGALATFFTVGYLGVSLPVVGAGLALQHLSPKVTLLIFAAAVSGGILAAAPVLVRPAAGRTRRLGTDNHPMTAQCRCFGADLDNGPRMTPRDKPSQRGPLAGASRSPVSDDSP